MENKCPILHVWSEHFYKSTKGFLLLKETTSHTLLGTHISATKLGKVVVKDVVSYQPSKMYFPGDFVLAQLDGKVRFCFVVRYDKATYEVLTSTGTLSSHLEHSVRAGWRRDGSNYTLVDASSQNVRHYEAYSAFVACASQPNSNLDTHESQTQHGQHAFPKGLTSKVLAFLDNSKPTLGRESIVKVSTTLATMFWLAKQQTNQLIDQHIRDALVDKHSFSFPGTMSPDDILLHHANSPSVTAQLYAYYNIDMHALLDEYFSRDFLARHMVVQLGGFNMLGYPHVDLDGFDDPSALLRVANLLLQSNALVLVLSNISVCLAWLRQVGFKGKTVVVGRFSTWPSHLKPRFLHGRTSRCNLLGDLRVVLLQSNHPTQQPTLQPNKQTSKPIKQASKLAKTHKTTIV